MLFKFTFSKKKSIKKSHFILVRFEPLSPPSASYRDLFASENKLSVTHVYPPGPPERPLTSRPPGPADLALVAAVCAEVSLDMTGGAAEAGRWDDDDRG